MRADHLETGRYLMTNAPGELAFGPVPLPDDQSAFYVDVNRQIPALCQSLPAAVQTEAMLFFMRYAGVSPADEMDFFGRFPVPAWSIVYWLSRGGHSVADLSRETTALAIQAHALAMCLHSLDDHLVDGEMPPTPLVLLLRSQAWLRMEQALEGLAEGLPEGRRLVDGFLGDYYTAAGYAAPARCLEDYCGLFRRQMATGFMVPALLNMRAKVDRRSARRIEGAFGSFGIAWRLLDDLQDVRSDLARGVPSAVYLCLGEEGQSLWKDLPGRSPSAGDDRAARILMAMQAEKVCQRLCARIGRELQQAADIMAASGLPGLACELRCLGRPFHDGWGGGP